MDQSEQIDYLKGEVQGLQLICRSLALAYGFTMLDRQAATDLGARMAAEFLREAEIGLVDAAPLVREGFRDALTQFAAELLNE